MTIKVGRNDPCSCGSGKKHKKCCALTSNAAAVVDFAWKNLRQTEGRVVDQHLMPYLMNDLPPEIYKTAIVDCFPEELPEEMEAEHLLKQFGLPWMLFNWIAEDSFDIANFNVTQTIAVNYLNRYQSKLNRSEIQFIEAMNKTYYSFYCILEVEFEKTLIVKDLLLDTVHTIKEKQGTHFLKRGDIIFSRLLELDEQSIFVGMAPIIIPAKSQIKFIDFRNWLQSENNSCLLTPASLIEFGLDVLDYFFELVDYLYNPPAPILANTDGDLMAFSKSYFKLGLNIEDTLQCLLPLALLKKPDEILESAKKFKSGKIKCLEFPWLIKGNKKHKSWANTVMGQITLQKGTLLLETNSEKRAAKGKKLLVKYLGDNIFFQKTLLESPRQKFNSLDRNSKSYEPPIPFHTMPEVQEQLQAMVKSHWDGWFESPIPMLNHQTPLEAAQTKDGRERLEALLLYYERIDSERDDNTNYLKADIDYLRKRLNLCEEQLLL